MKNYDEIKEIKDKFERGEIAEEDIDQETQEEIMKMYKEEIEDIREDILVLREENKMYEEKIEELKNKMKK